jgi:hypothetical protein
MSATLEITPFTDGLGKRSRETPNSATPKKCATRTEGLGFSPDSKLTGPEKINERASELKIKKELSPSQMQQLTDPASTRLRA